MSPATLIGYWEATYQRFSGEYDELIKGKVWYANKLDRVDLMDLDEDEAKRTVNSQNRVNREIQVLKGQKQMMDQLKDAYYDALIDMDNYYRRKYRRPILRLTAEVIELKQRLDMAVELYRMVSDGMEAMNRYIQITAKPAYEEKQNDSE